MTNTRQDQKTLAAARCKADGKRTTWIAFAKIDELTVYLQNGHIPDRLADQDGRSLVIVNASAALS